MGRLGIAFRAFFAALFDPERADKISAQLGAAPEQPTDSPQPARASSRVKPPARNDALTLLAALQREARLLDLIHEPLEQYDDAQVGAAARDVMRDAGGVLKRMFDLQPLAAEPEGTTVEIAGDDQLEKYRLVGRVEGDPPFRGALVHPGWRAGKCELPEWRGGESAALIVAPAEVEVG